MPSELGFEPRSPRYGPCLVSRCWCILRRFVRETAQKGAFWRLFGPFLGRIVEMNGTRGLFDTVKSSRTCSVATVSLCLGVLPRVGGYFGRKMAVSGPKLRRFGGATSRLGASAPGRHR